MGITTQNGMRILLRLPNWLGDAVMASSLFYTLKNHYPNARFVLVGTKIACELFEKDESVEATFIDNTKNSPLRLLATYKLAQKINKCDLAITLSNHFYSAFLLYATKTPIRIGFAKFLRSFLLSHAIAKPPRDYHQVEKYCFLFSQFLKKELDRESVLPLNLAFNLHSRSNNTPKKIGFSPSASYGSAKRWLPPYYAKVASVLLEKGHEIYFFGAKEDSLVSEEILRLTQNELKNKALMTNATNLCGKTSIEELAQNIASLNLFITNDSGPMHVATSTNTPLIALFGPTDMQETSPYKAKKAVLLNHNLACSPCKKRICPLRGEKNQMCMKSITPTEVLQAAYTLLEGD
ncbi:lipopolysaccharide heptosyltransferase II [Helicobacter cetorum]|uniref:lipopolysaccharide heptosyltransferase II n=1 Tax=Helicobacter cetorum (strain ATCC BAA-540 / CCUG 52418 / MIT 99-5656) TaxID=1163745 RepID=I0ERL0_HELCM|nr:lipopolysaccharide heptosyltransferase II [Helicobacter cetorum]AFI05579.1 ADP-heptose--LPS heptosyltransferase II [Helicobacter cetorum MIT 99-5656]